LTLAQKTDSLKMLKNFKTKHKSILKRIFIKCVALFFVIYALADVSILQAYCGNESVGIPPAYHFSKEKNDSTEDIADNFQQPHEQKDSEQDCGDDCCICSSHVVINSYNVESSLVKLAKIAPKTTSYENRYPNSELRNLFRPPQIA
jgi:hypothetical protein